MAKKYKKSTNRKYKGWLSKYRAYWIGVGISAGVHGDGFNLIQNAPASVHGSLVRGYEDDNYHNVSRSVIHVKIKNNRLQ